MHDENFESNQLTETSSFCVSVADGFSDELSIFFFEILKTSKCYTSDVKISRRRTFSSSEILVERFSFINDVTEVVVKRQDVVGSLIKS